MNAGIKRIISLLLVFLMCLTLNGMTLATDHLTVKNMQAG
jgi:hypothetical protein